MQQTVIGNMKSQPEVLNYTLENQNVFVEPFVEIFKKHDIRKVFFFGSGTSYNVSHIAAYYFKQIVGIDASAQYPTVYKNYEKPDWTGMLKNDQILYVAISQSGTSVSTCEVMEYAKANGYQTLALTGNLESRIAKLVDTAVHLLVGEELTPPETKGYTVSVLSVYRWAIAVAKAKGIYTEEQYETALKETKALVDQFQTVVEESEAWYDRNKGSILGSERLYVLGYGVDYGSMLEGVLKMGEMLRLPIAGYELEEFSHGPTMAFHTRQTLFFIGSDEAEYERMMEFRRAYLKYTPRIHVITCKDMDADGRDMVFSVKANKYLAPLMYTVPFQFVAAKGAKEVYIDTNINPFEEPLAHYPAEEA